MSQVFNTCVREVYNVAVNANTPDQKAEGSLAGSCQYCHVKYLSFPLGGQH